MNRIKEVLENKGVKQTWLAEKLNKSYNMVNSYVQNRRQPSLEVLFKIAQILDVAVAELIQSSSNKKSYGVKKPKLFQVSESEEVYEQTRSIPVLGNINCGYPLLAEENIESEIPISNRLLKKSDTYFILRASGESMNEVGIEDGDLVLIRKEQTAQNRDQVVALIDDEATIKEYHKSKDMVMLKPRSRNKDYQPIILTRDFKVQGIVERVISIKQ